MKTHIVIPIGVSQPGTPILSLLEKSIDSILNQSSDKFILTIAADENVSADCRNLLRSKGVDVIWFPSASFFRRGGIWAKISDVWERTDTKYLSFLHYDDIWDPKKLELQVIEMEKMDLAYSWSEVYVIDENDIVCSGDCSFIQSFDSSNVQYKTIGLSHSMIVRREEFFNSGIMTHKYKWSPVWENLFILYMQKMGNGKKVDKSIFYWRNHSMNMTNSIFVLPELKPIMDEQRVIGNYSNVEIDKDIHEMNECMNNLIQELIIKYLNGKNERKNSNTSSFTQ
jgi:hypothetical protein